MIDRDLYDVEDIRITLKAGAEYDAVELARLVQSIARHSQWTARDFLYIARCLLKGEGWEPPLGCLDLEKLTHHRRNGPFEFKLTMREDPQSVANRRWLEVHDLLERACAGEAEAAIEYCRQVKAGRIYLGPSAGSAP